MLSIYGHLMILVNTIILALYLNFSLLLVYFFLLSLYSMIIYPKSFSRIFSGPLLLFAGLIIVCALCHSRFSQHGFIDPDWIRTGGKTAGYMLIRAASIFLAAQIFSQNISPAELARLTDHTGLKGFGFMLGLALHLIPLITKTARIMYESMKLRGFFRKNICRSFAIWIFATCCNVLQKSNEITAAARSRSWGIESPKQPLPSFHSGDLVPAISLLAFLALGIAF